MKVELNRKEHIYKIDNKVVPSVSDIIQAVFSVVLPDEYYLQRGRAVHKAINLYLQNNLNEKTIDERIKAYFETAKKVIKLFNIVPSLIEQSFYHDKLNYAGTIDLLTKDNILIDWKLGHYHTAEIQLGGYALLLENEKIKIKKILEIVINESVYKISEYNIQRAKNLFLATLTIYNFRKEVGL